MQEVQHPRYVDTNETTGISLMELTNEGEWIVMKGQAKKKEN